MPHRAQRERPGRPLAVAYTHDPYRGRVLTRVLEDVGYAARRVTSQDELVARLERRPGVAAVIIDQGSRDHRLALADFLRRGYPALRVTVLPPPRAAT